MPTSPEELPPLSALQSILKTDLTQSSDQELLSAFTVANSAFHSYAEHAVTAEAAYGELILERICRTVQTAYPDAVWLPLEVVHEFHVDQATGEPVPDCPGHNAKFVTGSVLDVNGQPIGTIEEHSPVHYFLEQISEVWAFMEPGHLLLEHRDIVYPDQYADDTLTSVDDAMFDDMAAAMGSITEAIQDIVAGFEAEMQRNAPDAD